MEQNLLKKASANMAFIGAILISAGFVIAERTPAPQSIGVALIFLHPFFNGNARAAFHKLATSKYVIGLCMYYLLIVLSAIYTSNWHVYQQLIVMQLPLVLLPFGLSNEGVLTAKQKDIIMVVLVSSVLLAGMASFINYIINFDTIKEEIKHSKPIVIVTKVNHIYYSILLAFSAAILQWWLFVRKIKTANLKILSWAGLIIAVLLLHTISARTGLLCFYVEAGASVIWLMVRRKSIMPGIIIVGIMAVLAFVTVKMVPTMVNRIANTQVDLKKSGSGEDINFYSISMRLAALKAGTQVFKNNPVFGVGPADIQDEMNQEYTRENSKLFPENRIKPHNQFMYTLVSLGIIGGLALCFIMFMPFVTRDVFKNYLLLVFLIICLVAFQAEYMLERQVGITFFCLFYMIVSKGINDQLSETNDHSAFQTITQ